MLTCRGTTKHLQESGFGSLWLGGVGVCRVCGLSIYCELKSLKQKEEKAEGG